MPIDAFVDTNVLVYAAYPGPGEDWKQDIAIDLIERQTFAVSSQVMLEFLNATTRKRKPGLSLADAYGWLHDLSASQIIAVDNTIVGEAVALAERYGIVFWDGAILAAAERTGAKILYTEDLNDGQRYGSLRVVNPFRKPAPSIGTA